MIFFLFSLTLKTTLLGPILLRPAGITLHLRSTLNPCALGNVSSAISWHIGRWRWHYHGGGRGQVTRALIDCSPRTQRAVFIDEEVKYVDNAAVITMCWAGRIPESRRMDRSVLGVRYRNVGTSGSGAPSVLPAALAPVEDTCFPWTQDPHLEPREASSVDAADRRLLVVTRHVHLPQLMRGKCGR